VRFHAGTARDDRDRTLAEILDWDDGRLERVHDYIQWLFPLPERSAFNAAAPVLTDADIEAFRNQPDLRAALYQALRRLLAFYGFEIREAAEGESIVIRAHGYLERSQNWLTPGNHNFLRISRILRALTLLGLETEARAFLVALETVYAENDAVIGPVTLAYWRRAVEG
jgi:hypothetical protein